MATTEWTQEAGMTGDIDADNVQDLVDQAEDSKDAAAASETAAANSATAAATSATNAANSSASASSSASDASTSETNAATSATSAASSATSSASSASAASTSASNAATSATAAAASETAAGTSETNAATSATNAASSASDALTQAGNASTSASAASSSASAAAASESAAASSETAAGTSETNAANSATSASTSATNAANSETNAATSATNAATSETNAATSASSASTSATAAQTAKTAAETAQAAAEAAQEAIDGTYLGALASNPTVDGNGNAVTTGDWYFNTTDSQAYIYNGSTWDALAPDLVGDTTPQLGGNLDTNGNNVNFGDNDKAIFGAGSDLEIYSDGSNGYFKTFNNGYIQTTDALGGGLTVLDYNSLGIVKLYAGNSEKLSTKSTGIDVTGVITTDGLTTSADITFGDNNKAIFGAGSDLQIYHTGAHSYIDDQGTGNLYLNSNGSGTIIQGGGTQARFFNGAGVDLWYNNAQRLATTSTGIDVTGTVTADGASLDGTVVINESGANVDFRVESDPNPYAFWIDGTYDNAVRIGTNVAKTTDNLCIGDAGGATLALVGRGNAGSDVNTIEFRDRHNATYTYGQVGGFIKSHRDGVGVAHYMTFGTTDADADAVERMRIDSIGNVLVGKTSSSFSTVGVEATSTGKIRATMASDNPISLNRTTSDGDIAVFAKDGATVGSIGTNSGKPYIVDSFGVGVSVNRYNGESALLPYGGGSAADAVGQLGDPDNRWKDLYLSGGIYLGGTGSANYLDDYEEGTFTPQIIGTSITGVLSYASQLGRYTKIGNLVYVSIYIYVNGITTQPDGDVKFTGLPFTVYSVQTTGASTPYFNSVDNGNRAGTLVEAENTQTRLAFRYLTNNAVAGHYQGSEINTNSQFRISLAYTIA